jgi:hypothetical protein
MIRGCGEKPPESSGLADLHAVGFRTCCDAGIPRMEAVPVEKFIHNQNLALFRKKLNDPQISEAEREVVRKLLADEEAKEGTLSHSKPADQKPS